MWVFHRAKLAYEVFSHSSSVLGLRIWWDLFKQSFLCSFWISLLSVLRVEVFSFFISRTTMTSFKNLSLAFSSTDKMGSQLLERWCAPAVYSLLNPPSVTSVISMQLTETSQAQDYQWYGLQWGMHSRSRCMVEAEREACFHANTNS